MHPVNFRDVGEALGLWLDPSPLPKGRLFRGGKFDTLSTLDELGRPKTILNLRLGEDPRHLGVAILHVPAPDDLENYDTRHRRVSDWVRRALAALAAPETEWPVYVHCTSGRDRTGVVIAALLTALGVPHDCIVGEFLFSDGADESRIREALPGLRSVDLLDVQSRQVLRQRWSGAG